MYFKEGDFIIEKIVLFILLTISLTEPKKKIEEVRGSKYEWII
ncbi:TPA: hypothetical protein ACG3Q6_003484 [Clostridioides difficile]